MEFGLIAQQIAVEAGHLELIEYLIVRGVDINATDNYGKYVNHSERCRPLKLSSTPLHTALMYHQNYDIARILLDYGSDLGIQNIDGRTPLHCWANDVVRHVLQVHDGPVDLYAADNNGMTVVHFMSRSKLTSPEQIRRLVGNDVHCLAAQDNLGYSPIHYALMRGNTALSSYLLDRDILPATGFIGASGPSFLHAAVQSSRTEVIHLVLCRCPYIQDVDHLGRSAVHAAVLVDNAAAVKEIAELGASELLHRPDARDETPLQLAQRVQAKSCIALLGSMGVIDAVPIVRNGQISRVEKTAHSILPPAPGLHFSPVIWMILLFSMTCVLLLYEFRLDLLW